MGVSGWMNQFSLRRLAGAAGLFGLLLVLVMAPGAGAFGGVDRSFGERGMVDLTYEPEAGTHTVSDDLATAPDGKIYVLDRTYVCGSSSCSSTRYLIRFRPNGSRDMTYGGDGSVELALGPEAGADVLVDRRGRQLVASLESPGVRLRRLRRNGAPDLSFGRDGVANVPCGCTGGTEVTLAVDKSGAPRFTVFAWGGDFENPTASIVVGSLTSRGAVDRDFGDGGLASTAIENGGPEAVVAGLPGGGEAVVGGSWSGQGLYIVKMGARGGFNQRFAAKARRTLVAWAREEGGFGVSGQSLVARHGGRLDLVGSAGSDGVVLRLRSDGGRDRRFGQEGVKYLPWTVNQAIVGPGGRVFTLGRQESSYRPVAGWIGRGGLPLRSFAGGVGAVLSESGASWSRLKLALQPGGHPLVLDPGLQECRGDCPPRPSLMRLTRWAQR